MIQIPQGYFVTSLEPIDSRLIMTKEQMRNAKDEWMPEVYFSICSEPEVVQGREVYSIYIYNKGNQFDPETGKFRIFAGDYEDLTSLPSINGVPVLGSEAGGHYFLQGILDPKWPIQLDSEIGHHQTIRVVFDGKTIKTGSEGLYVEFGPIKGLIDSGAERAKKAEEALQEAIDSEAERAKAKEEELETRLDSEVEIRAKTDSELRKHIDSEIARLDSEKQDKFETIRPLKLENDRLTILFDSETILNGSEGLYVPFDNETIVLNSEGKVIANLDNRTLAYDTSEGIRVHEEELDLAVNPDFIRLDSEKQDNLIAVFPIEIDSENNIKLLFDSETLFVNNNELEVLRPVPPYGSEDLDKALRVIRDGASYKIDWQTVGDVDDLAVSFSKLNPSEGDYLFASKRTSGKLYFNTANKTVYLDLDGKQDKIGQPGDRDVLVTANNLLNPTYIYQGTSETSWVLLRKSEKNKLTYKPVPMEDLTWGDSESRFIVKYKSGARAGQIVPFGSEDGEGNYGNYKTNGLGFNKIAYNGLDKNLLYFDSEANVWHKVDTVAKQKLTPLYLKNTSKSSLEFGIKLDNATIKLDSEGRLISNGFAMPSMVADKYLRVNSEATGWILDEAGKVDDIQINGTSTVKNKISNILLDTTRRDGRGATLEYVSNTSEYTDSERHLRVNIYNALPQITVAQQGKALIVDSENHLTWGEAGKVDALKVKDALSHEKQLDPVNKIVTIEVDKGLQITSEGKIIHINEVAPQTRTANHILVPAGTDAQGHIIDGTTNTVANGLRELTFNDRTNNAGAYVDTSKPWAIIADPTNVTNTTNVALKVAGFDGTKASGHKYDNATLMIDANGLQGNYKVETQKILSTDTSEGLIIISGNKVKLADRFLDRITLNDFRKRQIDSEGLNDSEDRFYPTIQLLNTELEAKQDSLTPIWPITIGSEGSSEANVLKLHFDGNTIISTPTEGLRAGDLILSYISSELYLHQVLPNTISEGNPLVNEDTMEDAISSNLGKFIGNYDSEGALPAKTSEFDIDRNDYAFVTVPVYDSQGNVEYFYHRYKFVDDTSETGHWQFEYQVSGSAFTRAQLDVLNSKWTEQLTNAYKNHVTNLDPLHLHVTQAEKTAWNAKQDALSAGDHINATSLTAKTIKVDTQTLIVDATTNDSKIPTIGAIKNYFKKKQTAVDSNTVTASSEGTYFISRIQQDAQGVITPSKVQYTYNNIPNKPQINGITVEGNKTLAQLGLAAADGIKIETDGKTVKHTNSVTAQNTQEVYNLTYDAQGHITGAPVLYNPNWVTSVNNRTVVSPTDSDIIKTVPNVLQGTDANKTSVVIAGNGTPVASGTYSVAEGSGTQATGSYAHAEGRRSVASGYGAHAEGWGADPGGSGGTASGISSHAEGANTLASGVSSHAEGYYTTASGMSSHAEGNHTIASIANSHAEGSYTQASSYNSHAEGDHTVTSTAGASVSLPQHVQGKYNVANANFADIVGWGTSEGARKNISSLTTTGELHLAKDVYINAKNDGTGGLRLVPPLTSEGYVLAIATMPSGSSAGSLEWVPRSTGGSSGTDNYTALTNKPTINGTVITGAMTGNQFVSADRGLSFGADNKTVGHSNTQITAKTTQEVYNITHDTYGHITASQLYNPDWVLSVNNRTVASPTDSDIIKTVPYVLQGSDTNKTAVVVAGTNTASGANAVAEGSGTTASGAQSHAEGNGTTASQAYAHTEGQNTVASGRGAHAEGTSTQAKSQYAHAEGYNTVAGIRNGPGLEGAAASHAEGLSTSATGQASHAEGVCSKATGQGSHAEGYGSADSEGPVASGQGSHAEGTKTTASGNYSHAQGQGSIASGLTSFAGGVNSSATGERSFSFGNANVAGGDDSVVFGSDNVTTANKASIYSGSGNHLHGVGTVAIGSINSVSTAADSYSIHVGGSDNSTDGYSTIIIGGDQNTASGSGSAIINSYQSSTNGAFSTIIGSSRSVISSEGAVILGGSTNHANHSDSVLIGTDLTSTAEGQLVTGRYNSTTVDNSQLFVIGNGTSTTPKNAVTVNTNGNTHIQGKLYINSKNDGTGGLEIVPPLTSEGYVLSIKTKPTSTSAGELQWIKMSSGGGTGTVTSVGVQNATNGGLTVTGSPITSSGTITIGHTNSVTANTTSGLKYFTYDVNGHIKTAVNKTLGRGINDQSNVIGHSNTEITAQTTQAFYPITMDTYGHITAYGSGTQIAKFDTEGQNIGTTVNISYLPYNSTTQSSYVPTFNWLAFWKGSFNTSGGSNLQYGDKGQLVGTGLTTRTVGSTDRPVYVNNGTATRCNTPESGSWHRGVPFVSSAGVMEVGKYLDFHDTNGGTSNYDVRLYTNSSSKTGLTAQGTSSFGGARAETVITSAIHNFFQANNTVATRIGKSIEILKVPLDTVAFQIMCDNNDYAISDGGIQVKKAGTYKVSGSLYYNFPANLIPQIGGIYIRKGTTEVNSVYIPMWSMKNKSLQYYYGTSTPAITWDSNNKRTSQPKGNIAVPPILVTCAAGDILYLCGRLSYAGSTEASSTWGGASETPSHILVERVY